MAYITVKLEKLKEATSGSTTPLDERLAMIEKFEKLAQKADLVPQPLPIFPASEKEGNKSPNT